MPRLRLSIISSRRCLMQSIGREVLYRHLNYSLILITLKATYLNNLYLKIATASSLRSAGSKG